MSRLQGKVAIVTGSSRGIGRAIALRLAGDGAAVAVNFVRDEAAARAVVAEIEGLGGKAVAIRADVGSVPDLARLFDETEAALGRPDILVNNAGVLANKPLAETDESDFDRLMAANVKGPFFACSLAAKRLNDGGRIVNLSSTTTAMMLPTYALYVATKAAVEGFSRVLAKELGGRAITVNVVSPGPTDTELFREGKTEGQIDGLARMAALGRLGVPDDIADVVAFLASDEARWITGQNIRVNGELA